MTQKRNWLKTMGWAGISACAVCCAFPVIGAAAGIGVLTTMGIYLEKIAIVILGIAGVLFALHYYQKNKKESTCSTTCEVDCDCQDHTSSEKTN